MYCENVYRHIQAKRNEGKSTLLSHRLVADTADICDVDEVVATLEEMRTKKWIHWDGNLRDEKQDIMPFLRIDITEFPCE